MCVVIYPALSRDQISLVFYWVKKRRAILTQQNIFTVLAKVIDPTNLASSTVIWIRPVAACPFASIYGLTQIIVNVRHLLQRQLSPTCRDHAASLSFNSSSIFGSLSPNN